MCGAQHLWREAFDVEVEDDGRGIDAHVRAGARGYLLKGASATETLQAIRTVAAGGAIFSPTAAERVLSVFTAPSGDLRNTSTRPFLISRTACIGLQGLCSRHAEGQLQGETQRIHW